MPLLYCFPGIISFLIPENMRMPSDKFITQLFQHIIDSKIGINKNEEIALSPDKLKGL